MKMNLESGDKCFVRLYTGEVVEAKYIRRIASSDKSKPHAVIITGTGRTTWATSFYPSNSMVSRFVYPVSEMKKQMRLQ